MKFSTAAVIRELTTFSHASQPPRGLHGAFARHRTMLQGQNVIIIPFFVSQVVFIYFLSCRNHLPTCLYVADLTVQVIHRRLKQTMVHLEGVRMQIAVRLRIAQRNRRYHTGSLRKTEPRLLHCRTWQRQTRSPWTFLTAPTSLCWMWYITRCTFCFSFLILWDIFHVYCSNWRKKKTNY